MFGDAGCFTNASEMSALMNGEVDQYPEAAFNLVGTIEDAIAKGKKMLEEAK